MWSFLCPNGTIFSQELFTCVWWFDFDCETAEDFYNLNEGLYKTPETSAVEESVYEEYENEEEYEEYEYEEEEGEGPAPGPTLPVVGGEEDELIGYGEPAVTVAGPTPVPVTQPQGFYGAPERRGRSG